MTNLSPEQYCVYLNNWPFINNSGQLGMCCKNNWVQLTSPFQSIVNTSLRELWEGFQVKHVRQQMLDGDTPKGCNVCYDHEKNVDLENSFRNRSLKGLMTSQGLKPWITGVEAFNDLTIRALDLRVGSTCNLACTMCHPSDSSKWYSLYNEYRKAVGVPDSHYENVKRKYKPSNLNWAEHDSSWENIFSSIDGNLTKIYLAGGEPFFIKKFPEYATELVNYAPDASIDINTNSTCSLQQKHLDKLAGKLNLRISIDGYKQSEEYQRLGTSWEEKVAVMDQYVKYFNIKSFDLTITSLTVRQLPELIEFLSNRYPGIIIMLRPVINRDGLRMNEIPLEFRKRSIDFLHNIMQSKTIQLNNQEQFMHQLTKDYSNKKEEMKKLVTHWDKISPFTLGDYDEELATWVYN
jgi:molybdenum cofactor biosynthesis enzyme MoaA